MINSKFYILKPVKNNPVVLCLQKIEGNSFIFLFDLQFKTFLSHSIYAKIIYYFWCCSFLARFEVKSAAP